MDAFSLFAVELKHGETREETKDRFGFLKAKRMLLVREVCRNAQMGRRILVGVVGVALKLIEEA